MSPIQQMLLGAGGGDETLYMQDVFFINTFLGTSSSRNIVNGVKTTEGALVVSKQRTSPDRDWNWIDTERGATKVLKTNTTGTEVTASNSLTAFNNNGFTIGNAAAWNSNNQRMATWTFRKHPKFFDIKTKTTNSSIGTTTVTHDLECDLGMAIFKSRNQTSQGYNWILWHKNDSGYYYRLNTNDTRINFSPNSYNASTKTFTLGYPMSSSADRLITGNGQDSNLICYFFASNNNNGDFAGQTGSAGDIIKCGKYTGNGSRENGPAVNVGFRPDFVFITRVNSGDNTWWLDAQRGISSFANSSRGRDQLLRPQGIGYEISSDNLIRINPDGFSPESTDNSVNASGNEYLYMAIRAADGTVGKPFDGAGTDYFAMDTGSGDTVQNFDSSFPVGFALYRKNVNGADDDWKLSSRITNRMFMHFKDSESRNSNDSFVDFAFDDGWGREANFDSTYQSWMWKTGQGCDCVTYRGTNSARTIKHGLGGVPEMIWVCNRESNEDFYCGHMGNNDGVDPWDYELKINTNSQRGTMGMFNDTPPTSTEFYLLNDNAVNQNDKEHFAVLFRSISGISKCGYYTGTGNNSQYINVGFGIRFLVIKRTDSSGDWMVFDSLRGFGNSGTNDSILKFNSSFAPTSSNVMNLSSQAFNPRTSDSNLNASGGKYIYYAHA
tara:strand:+ start:1 stop:1995 length:1995 start_codon:yes stop_codon:yes gene_type:complete